MLTQPEVLDLQYRCIRQRIRAATPERKRFWRDHFERFTKRAKALGLI